MNVSIHVIIIINIIANAVEVRSEEVSQGTVSLCFACYFDIYLCRFVVEVVFNFVDKVHLDLVPVLFLF